MLNVGGAELLIILLVALIFLGPTRLPEVARQIGQAAGSLKAMASGFQAELEAASKPTPAPAGDPSMHLSGPTPQDEAIAATQPDSADLLAAARETTYDDAHDGATIVGGPTDLSNPVTGAYPPPDQADEPDEPDEPDEEE